MKSYHKSNDARRQPAVMPILALGHVWPALAAAHATTGSYNTSWALLGMIVLTMGLVDACDSYKDIEKSSRPKSLWFKVWMMTLIAAWITCIANSPWRTVLYTQRFLLFGMTWGIPCIPTKSHGVWVFHKPKAVLCEAKSLFTAVCLSLFCADSVTLHFCEQRGGLCHSASRFQVVLLSVLYNYIRETVNDARDIDEDLKNEIQTLPVRLGKTNTLLLLGGIALVGDPILTQAVWLTPTLELLVDIDLLASATFRVVLTMTAYWIILRYPRRNMWAWGTCAVIGLFPVLVASSLRSSELSH